MDPYLKCTHWGYKKVGSLKKKKKNTQVLQKMKWLIGAKKEIFKNENKDWQICFKNASLRIQKTS